MPSLTQSEWRLSALVVGLCAALSFGPAAAADDNEGLEQLYLAAKGHYDAAAYAESREAFEKIVEQCEGKDAGAVCAYAHLGLANTLQHLGQVADARKHLAVAVPLFNALNDSPGEAECLFLAGGIDLQQSHFAEAAEAFRECRGLRQAMGDVSGEVSAMRCEGQARRALADYAGARKLYRAALDLADQSGDVVGEAAVLTCMANMDFKLKLPSTAAKDWGRALDLYKQAKNRQGWAHVLCQLANWDRVRGQFSHAFDKCEIASGIYAGLGMPRGQADALHQVSLIYQNQGLYPTAILAAERAEKTFRQLGDRSAVASCRHQIGFTLARSAEQERGEKRRKLYDQAAECLTESRRIFAELKQRTGEMDSIEELAVIDREVGRFDEAVERSNKTLEYYRTIEDVGGQAASLYNLGVVSEKKKDPDQAEKYLRQSLKAYEEVESRLGKIRVRQALARIHAARKETAKAEEELRKAINDIEETRGNVAGAFGERAAFFSSQLSAFEQMVALHLEGGDPDPASAFEYADRSRARAILDLLVLSQVDLWDTIKDKKTRNTLDKLETANGQKLADVTYALAELDMRTGSSKQDAAKQREELVLDRQAVLDEARDLMFRAQQASGLYHKRSTTNLKPLPANEIRDALNAGAGEVMLSYYVGREKSYAWLIQPGSEAIKWSALQHNGNDVGRHAIEKRVGHFMEIGGKWEPTVRGFSRVKPARAKSRQAEAEPLYDLLVPKDFRPILAKARHVIIVPDGMLRQMPFEALVIAGTTDEPVYWIDKLPPIAYSPSATIWHHLRELRGDQKADGALDEADAISILALGSPQFGAPAEEVVVASAAELPEPLLRGDDLLVPLPGTKREINAIADLFEGDGKFFLDGNATEEELRNFAPHARYLHVASHGLVDTSKYFLYSRLALTPGGKGSDHTNDGALTLREILMEWAGELTKCELAVLSACDTSRGREDVSEGVFALPQGLFCAGVPAVVASLWRVDDKSTAELMEHFYKALREAEDDDEGKLSKAEALQAAKRAIRKKYPEPFYWAPFVFMGEHR